MKSRAEWDRDLNKLITEITRVREVLRELSIQDTSIRAQWTPFYPSFYQLGLTTRTLRDLLHDPKDAQCLHDINAALDVVRQQQPSVLSLPWLERVASMMLSASAEEVTLRRRGAMNIRWSAAWMACVVEVSVSAGVSRCSAMGSFFGGTLCALVRPAVAIFRGREFDREAHRMIEERRRLRQAHVQRGRNGSAAAQQRSRAAVQAVSILDPKDFNNHEFWNSLDVMYDTVDGISDHFSQCIWQINGAEKVLESPNPMTSNRFRHIKFELLIQKISETCDKDESKANTIFGAIVQSSLTPKKALLVQKRIDAIKNESEHSARLDVVRAPLFGAAAAAAAAPDASAAAAAPDASAASRRRSRYNGGSRSGL